MMVSRHNLIKIKALLFLRMRELVGHKWAGAGDIARAAEGSPDSLYVLLGRWVGWGLVKRLPAIPYLYCIARVGMRYLEQLDQWYIGDIQAIIAEVGIASRAVFWWGEKGLGSDGFKSIYYIRAPFMDASHFTAQHLPPGQFAISLNTGDRLIAKQCESAYAAMKQVEALGLSWQEPLAQALVDARLIKWGSNSSQNP